MGGTGHREVSKGVGAVEGPKEEFDSSTRVEQRKEKKRVGGWESSCSVRVKGRDGCWGGAGERKTLERDFPRLLLLSLWYGARVVADSARMLVPGTPISIVQQ